MEAHRRSSWQDKITDITEVSAFPHGCEQCDFKTKRHFDHKRHYMQRQSLCDVTYPCEKCAKVFNYENSLKRHTKTCQESIPKV